MTLSSAETLGPPYRPCFTNMREEIGLNTKRFKVWNYDGNIKKAQFLQLINDPEALCVSPRGPPLNLSLKLPGPESSSDLWERMWKQLNCEGEMSRLQDVFTSCETECYSKPPRLQSWLSSGSTKQENSKRLDFYLFWSILMFCICLSICL